MRLRAAAIERRCDVTMFLLNKQSQPTEEGQMELMEHLAELRTRLLRSLAYVIVGMALTYNFFPWIYDVISAPVQPVLAEIPGSGVKFDKISDPFMLRLQVSFIAGLAVAIPCIVLELWGFVAPALTDDEAKPIRFLAPFSVLLFVIGVLVAYACLPITFQWMGGFADDVTGAVLLLNANDNLLIAVKIMLAFGIAFELPLVLLFFSRVGLLSPEMMTKYWRHAIVVIAMASAIITPSADPITMLMMGIPMGVLYVMSIGLVRSFAPQEDGRSALSYATMLMIICVPVTILVSVSIYLWRTTQQQVKAPRVSQRGQATTPPKPAGNGNASAPATPSTTTPTLTGDATRDALALSQAAAETAQQAQQLAQRAANLAKQAQELAQKASGKPSAIPQTPKPKLETPKPAADGQTIATPETQGVGR